MKLCACLVKPATNELTSAASVTQLRSIDAELVNFASQVQTQRRGRPAFEVKEEQLIFHLQEGFNFPTTALLFRVSSRTVERRLKSMVSLYLVRISLFHFKSNLPLSLVDRGWYPGVEESMGHVPKMLQCENWNLYIENC